MFPVVLDVVVLVAAFIIILVGMIFKLADAPCLAL